MPELLPPARSSIGSFTFEPVGARPLTGQHSAPFFGPNWPKRARSPSFCAVVGETGSFCRFMIDACIPVS